MNRAGDTSNKPRYWLAPIAWLYGAGVALRNRLFDWKIFQSVEYDVPTISVGNITVGGTGKTPHIEYLVELLSPHYNVAVLSRGYKRKTQGYRLATPESSVAQIGDEPFQIKHKFPHVAVAVDSNRRRGIAQLLQLDPAIDVVLLDDAFQHRHVLPSLSILLVDYNRPITEDRLMPVGNLREGISSKHRANIIIVSKCPTEIKPMDIRIIYKHLNVAPFQRVYFTQLAYSNIQPLFPDCAQEQQLSLSQRRKMVLVAGVAQPQHFYREMEHYSEGDAIRLTFPDHHNFTRKDVALMESHLTRLNSTDAIVVMTEKDATRLQSGAGISDTLKSRLYYLPMTIQFVQEEQEQIFTTKLLKHVREYKKDRAVLK